MELQTIQNKIHEIRGQKVMLDFDLAEMYGTETAQLKRAVRRNIERFPDDFMFTLTIQEFNNLKNNMVCQIGISKKGGNQYAPFAFTEQGIAMLSSVLRSDTAIKVNISIMRAFVGIRQIISSSSPLLELQQEVKELKAYIEEAFADYNDINEDTRTQLELINLSLAELQAKRTENQSRPRIGYVNKFTNFVALNRKRYKNDKRSWSTISERLRRSGTTTGLPKRFIKSKKTRISLNTMYWTCSPILPVRDYTLATRSVI